MQQLLPGGLGIVAQGVVRFLACAGLLAAGLLMGGGIASADTGFGGLGGFGIGDEKKNDHRPRNDADQRPVSPPIVRIGARDDRGGFEVGLGGIRISREPGFRGRFDRSPDGARLTNDETLLSLHSDALVDAYQANFSTLGTLPTTINGHIYRTTIQPGNC